MCSIVLCVLFVLGVMLALYVLFVLGVVFALFVICVCFAMLLCLF